MSNMSSCNDSFYNAITDVIDGKKDVKVVEMSGGTPQIHKNAALKFVTMLSKAFNEKKPAVDDKGAPLLDEKGEQMISARRRSDAEIVSAVERLINYVNKYSKAAAAEAAAAEAAAEKKAAAEATKKAEAAEKKAEAAEAAAAEADKKAAELQARLDELLKSADKKDDKKSNKK